MSGFRIEGNTSGSVAEVDSDNNFFVRTSGFGADGVALGGGNEAAGAAVAFSEVDTGEAIGSREVLSAEVDKDYRLRVAHDNPLDIEQFNYTSQNTGKHYHAFTTLTATVSSSGLLTNSGNITTTATGMNFGTKRMFRASGTETLVCETSISFTAQPNSNTVFDFGLFIRGGSNPWAPVDGVYFRVTSTGMMGVVCNSGVETTTTGVFPDAGGAGTYVYTNNANNRYLIQINNVSVSFWINNVKYGEIPTPAGQAYPCKAQALPWSVRHSIVGGAAGAAFQGLISDYRVYLRGVMYADRLACVGNRVFGSYQGLSGGTLGSLATLANNANPTAAAPSNTALTANLPGGLGGQGLVTAAVAAATDLIFGEYGVPDGTVAVQGRSLCIRGVRVSAVNMGAAVATTATTLQLSLAYGHTAASLATAETASFATASTKAPRKVALGFMTWPVGAAIGAMPQCGDIFVDFGDAPIYVNPSERVALVGKFIVGTATASQTIQFVWQPVYGWE